MHPSFSVLQESDPTRSLAGRRARQLGFWSLRSRRGKMGVAELPTWPEVGAQSTKRMQDVFSVGLFPEFGILS